MTMNILLTGAYHYTTEQLSQIEKLGCRVSWLRNEQDALPDDASEYEAVVCNGLFLYHDINRFSRLRYLQLTSAGTDRVPEAYIRSNNILLHTARGVYSIPMAEWAVGKILEICKQSQFFYRNQQAKEWTKNRSLRELSGMKAIISGFGSVGTEIARRLRPFGVQLTTVDEQPPDGERIQLTDSWHTPDKLKEILPDCDILLLTLPLTEQTRHMIGKKELRLMQDDAILINLARGGIIDEQALVAELKKGRFAGVALDVFEEEPLHRESPLWDFPNVTVTPHNAYVSDKVNERLFRLILRNLENHMS